MMRYIRAFFTALAMTLRGEKPRSAGERRYPALADWLRGGQAQVAAVYTALDAAGLDAAARQQVAVRVDGRATHADALLGAVRHHLDAEYPHLLRDLTAYSVTGIYATNLNDQYWLDEILKQADLPPGVADALRTLHAHLAGIPPSSTLEAEAPS